MSAVHVIHLHLHVLQFHVLHFHVQQFHARDFERSFVSCPTFSVITLVP